LTPFLGGSYTT